MDKKGEFSDQGNDPDEEHKKRMREEDEEDKFVAENKKELYNLRKCIGDLPAKNRVAVEYTYVSYGGIYDDNVIEAMAKAGVKIDEDEEYPGLPNTEQITPPDLCKLGFGTKKYANSLRNLNN